MAKNYRFQPGIEKDPRKLRVLVAPLDWGLGHATRCIPVIYELMRQQAEVWLAAEGPQAELLRTEFPQLSFLPLPGYRVKYARSAAGLLRNLLIQTPRLLCRVRAENNWLKKAVEQYGFDAIISDNRYGLYHASVPSVFMTHQLLIKTPLGKWAERFLQNRNYRYINRFTECWVPDQEEMPGLAGELSHPRLRPAIPVQYTGLLSRLQKTGLPWQANHLFISLSGPEPQRTLLENMIIDQVSHYQGTATIVRGLPGTRSLIPSTNDIRFYNHLSTGEYNQEMEKAEYVISRSGYSTVMDIMRLGKKSILIPTPGQTEQEYLADYLHQQQAAFSTGQKAFSLVQNLEQARTFPYRLYADAPTGTLANTISRFLSSLSF